MICGMPLLLYDLNFSFNGDRIGEGVFSGERYGVLSCPKSGPPPEARLAAILAESS